MAFVRDPQCLIPIMTSNNTPRGLVISDMVVMQPYSCMIGVLNEDPYWYAGSVPAYIGYEFASRTIINKYNIYTRLNSPTRYPKGWTFEAWDGTNWVVLDTQENITNWYNQVGKSFTISNTKSYLKYRLNFKTLGNIYIALGVVEFCGGGTTLSQLPQAIGGF